MLKEPCTVESLSQAAGLSQSELEDFVTVASLCEYDGVRLLDARYHMFLRATESVFITLPPSGRLFLSRSKDYLEPKDGKQYHVFEINTCSSCHGIYLMGKLDDATGCLNQNSGYEGKDTFYLGKQIS